MRSRSLVNACVVVASLTVLGACQSTRLERNDADYLPYIGGNPQIIAQTPLFELRQLQLISTNLVSALVQIPELQVGSATLQVSNPKSAFGNTLVRALEDAGFGIQQVSADQGLNYVTYGKRFSETESGPVIDYGIAIRGIEVRREYDTTGLGVFPKSVLLVNGTDSPLDIQLDDSIFIEQGGSGDTFISGVVSGRGENATSEVSTVQVNEYDATPIDKRTDQGTVLSRARQRIYREESLANAIDLDSLQQLRRTVLIFEDKSSNVMGRGNKQAIRLMAKEFESGDVFAISACNDVDGMNAEAQYRAVRVEEEFVSHGVDSLQVHIEPCVRASYRHASDDSPVAVTIVQYR